MALFKTACLVLALGALLPVARAAAAPDLNRLLARAEPAEQVAWAVRYEHGEGVVQDYTSALHLYCAAARRGDALAQYQLGWLYANGRGVEQDDNLAAAWFLLAARQGDGHAQRMLERLGGAGVATAPRCVLPGRPGLEGHLMAGASPGRRQVEQWVRELAPRYQLDPELVLAVIQAESGFRVQAVSPKSAQGLMQLIPATADRFGVSDPFNPVDNLRGGMAYLRWLLAYFRGDVRLALAGYNAGEGAVERYRGVPPYSETRAYVAKILRIYGFETHPVTPGIVEPSTMAVAMELKLP